MNYILAFLLIIFVGVNAGLVGNWTKYDDDNIPLDFLNAANWALGEINSVLPSGTHKLEKIMNARSQIISGLKLEFTVITTHQSNTNRIEVR